MQRRGVSATPCTSGMTCVNGVSWVCTVQCCIDLIEAYEMSRLEMSSFIRRLPRSMADIAIMRSRTSHCLLEIRN